MRKLHSKRKTQRLTYKIAVQDSVRGRGEEGEVIRSGLGSKREAEADRRTDGRTDGRRDRRGGQAYKSQKCCWELVEQITCPKVFEAKLHTERGTRLISRARQTKKKREREKSVACGQVNGNEKAEKVPNRWTRQLLPKANTSKKQ